MPKVTIHKSTPEGIQLSIGNDQFGFNKATGVVKTLKDGHWVAIDPKPYIRQILQDRHQQSLDKEAAKEAHAKKLAFLDARPTYQNSRQRQRAAMDQFCMGVMS